MRDYLRENTDKKFWLVNTNKLVRFYPGVDGVKTGFTTEAKYCLTASAEKNGMRVISVVMGAPTSKERNSQVTKLLDYAFGQYTTKKLYKRGEKIQTVQVGKGKKEKVDLVATDNVSLLMKKGEDMDKIKKEIIAEKKVKAPIKKGDALGTLVITKDREVLLKQTIVAKEDVDATSWWELFKRSFGIFSTSK